MSWGAHGWRRKKYRRTDFAKFRDAVTRLAEIYPPHIQVEDQVLFPAAERALSSEQKAEIAAEMALRRSVKPVTL